MTNTQLTAGQLGRESELVEAAHALSRFGLVTAYGHVSARAEGSFVITPGADLATVNEAALIRVPLDATALPANAPGETWVHLALYNARPDAAAIARAQPASGFAVAASTSSMSPLYGQAAWLGESVPVHDDATLLRSAEAARAVARSLPSGEALLLRGNGAVTIGGTPGLAVSRMWLLDAVCATWLAARSTGPPIPLTTEEIASWRAAGDELLPRLWQHLRTRGLAQVAP